MRNINAHQPITWEDLGWFNQVTGTRLGHIEVELIELLDNLFLKAQADAKSEEADD